MEPKEFDFEFPRGDTCPYLFEITDEEGNVLNLTQTSEIIMTARDLSKNIVFQKKLSRSEVAIDGKSALIMIEHKDTKDLKIGGKYKYDIEFSDNTYHLTMIIGTFKLTEEETY